MYLRGTLARSCALKHGGYQPKDSECTVTASSSLYTSAILQDHDLQCGIEVTVPTCKLQAPLVPRVLQESNGLSCKHICCTNVRITTHDPKSLVLACPLGVDSARRQTAEYREVLGWRAASCATHLGLEVPGSPIEGRQTVTVSMYKLQFATCLAILFRS